MPFATGSVLQGLGMELKRVTRTLAIHSSPSMSGAVVKKKFVTERANNRSRACEQ